MYGCNVQIIISGLCVDGDWTSDSARVSITSISSAGKTSSTEGRKNAVRMKRKKRVERIKVVLNNVCPSCAAAGFLMFALVSAEIKKQQDGTCRSVSSTLFFNFYSISLAMNRISYVV
ncbi:hypothetical protein Pint_23823 [Pistacia integerrima]|uniref:Uncharacterized protein n=1 Tax=Pistacia integerrima TaxID=434235 RepID=A0ACC0YNH4_9ROSI|nr:hypothetical protein Pint_23823 [Pistacia integerrima]